MDGLLVNSLSYEYKPLALWVEATVSCTAGYRKKSLCLFFVLFSAAQAFAWTDGELLIWMSPILETFGFGRTHPRRKASR
jgi:hypothetical protein